MNTQPQKARRFLALHVPGRPLLLPNPWDEGSAKVLASRGFEALATTSSGHAMSLGRADGRVSRDEALAHAGHIVAATPLPVSADLERGFADDPAGVAQTVRLAKQAGLAGCSIEDFTGVAADPIYDASLAAERIAAAVQAAREGADAGEPGLVITARAENYLHGRPDLGDTIARLRAFADAGADVLYAPGLTRLDDIRQVVRSVGAPVNVLVLPGGPPVPELAAAGVSRISVGGAFAFAVLAALAAAADELRTAASERRASGDEPRRAAGEARGVPDDPPAVQLTSPGGTGPYAFLERAAAGRALAGEAFSEARDPAGGPDG